MSSFTSFANFLGTTIIAVRRSKSVALAGDGQVTQGNMIVKSGASKLRRLSSGNIIGGFAGSTADSLTLFEKLEKKLEECSHQLLKASVELAKEWRGDKYLRRLEALMLVADRHRTLLLSGTGDVLDTEGGVAAIGSGGSIALAAGRALLTHSKLSASEVARKSLLIASDICIYTNDNIIIEKISDE